MENYNKDINDEECWVSGNLVIGLVREKSKLVTVVWDKNSKHLLSRKMKKVLGVSCSSSSAVRSKIISSSNKVCFDPNSRELITQGEEGQIIKFKVEDDGKIREDVYDMDPRVGGEQIRSFKVEDDGTLREVVYDRIYITNFQSPYILAIIRNGSAFILSLLKLENNLVTSAKSVDTVLNLEDVVTILVHPHAVLAYSSAQVLYVQVWDMESQRCIKRYHKQVSRSGNVCWMKLLYPGILLIGMWNYVGGSRLSVNIFDFNNLLSDHEITTRELDINKRGFENFAVDKISSSIGTFHKNGDAEFEFRSLTFRP